MIDFDLLKNVFLVKCYLNKQIFEYSFNFFMRPNIQTKMIIHAYIHILEQNGMKLVEWVFIYGSQRFCVPRHKIN